MDLLDESTGRPCLAKADLKHGEYYKGRCRNATVARWNAEADCFFHWREKLGRIYIQTIKYPTDEPRFDVFFPVSNLDDPKFEIPFDEGGVFRGQVSDLIEFNPEMWAKVGQQ
jgi:hypothetical protein